MAEVAAFRNNALPYPVWGVSFTVVIPILDADGDVVTSATGLDSEISKNGDTPADCTNEATEIGSSGQYYLTLTGTEMQADIISGVTKTSSSGAKTTCWTLYPRKLTVLATGTCQGSNDTSDIQLASGDSPVDDYYNGCLCVATIDTIVEARIINDYVGSTKVGEVSPAWSTAQPDSGDTYVIYLPEGRQVVKADVVAANNVAVTTTGAVDANVVSHSTAGKAEINAEVLDVLNVDTFAEVGQESPAATQTLRKMIAYIYKSFRNKKTQTSSQFSLFADDASTVDQKATVSDDGTTTTIGEIATGP